MAEFRRIIIKTAEVMMVLLVIITILATAGLGAISGSETSGALAVAGFVLGGVGGLIVSSIFASSFFLILEIAENTRQVLRYYEPKVDGASR
ncbi:hypothetical protein [Rhodopseudomonas pseudopalustris]|nr:hypothetical protein [Rhodopseudomonas pseudopalustris]SEO14162.1 hypothetical protein SAMN05444123_101435 [Rhodopseudomonas pseudopalustris]